MRKILSLISIALLAISFVGCSNDDEPTESITEKQVNEIASILNGKFFATVNDLAGTKTYEITFTPYASPKEMEFTIPGEYVNLEKKVKVYGECKEVEYYNDHLLQTDTDWRYIINVGYEGAQPELWFYPISVYGRYETHKIKVINSNSFTLDDITYTKQ